MLLGGPGKNPNSIYKPHTGQVKKHRGRVQYTTKPPEPHRDQNGQPTTPMEGCLVIVVLGILLAVFFLILHLCCN